MENWNIFNGTLNKQLFYNEEIKPVYIEHKWSKWGSNQLIFGIQPYAQIQKMLGLGGWGVGRDLFSILPGVGGEVYFWGILRCKKFSTWSYGSCVDLESQEPSHSPTPCRLNHMTNGMCTVLKKVSIFPVASPPPPFNLNFDRRCGQ